MELRSRLSLNLGWVVSSWIILFVAYFLRIGLHPFVEGDVYLSFGSIATIIILLPEWIVSKSESEQPWFKSREMFTLLVVVMVSALGLVAGPFDAIVYALSRLFWILAVILVVWTTYRIGLRFQIPLLAGSTVLSVLFVMDLYKTNGVSPFFYELIVQKTAFIDTLGHAAISNMIATQLVPTVGLDGIVLFKYHWGSHALLGGIINLASTDAVAGYNLAYPAIFLVLLFKTMMGFIMRIGEFYGHQLRPLAVLMGIFLVMLVPMLITRPYMWLESTTIANVFMFLFLGIVMVYSRQSKSIETPFLVFSVIILVMLSVLKISHGFVLVCGLGVVALRMYPSMRTLIQLGIGGLLILLVVIFFVYPIAQATEPAIKLSVNELIYYFGQRLTVFWSNSGFPWSYILGLGLIIVIWGKRGYLSSLDVFKKTLKERKFVEMEALVIINLSGLGGAIYVSGHGLDVFFFLSVQLLLSTCYLLFRLALLISDFSVPRPIVAAGVFILLGIGASTKANLLDLFVFKSDYVDSMNTLTPPSQAVHDLMADLKQLRKDYNPRETAIYIAQKEHWYHGSQENTRGAPFLVPAISGIVSISGISESVWYSSNTHYGFDDYRNLRDELIYEIDEAIEFARDQGFKQLISYTLENQKLVREVIEL